MFEYHTLNDLIKLSADNNLEIWEIIQQADMYENDRSESDSFNMMKEMYVAMKNADSMYDGTLRSASNKAGGDGGLLHSYNGSGKNICGSFMGKVMEKAIKMGESDACMRRIVAAPTAGSCGVLPAVLLSYEEDFDVAEDDMVKAMYVAAGIGKVIAENAFIAGAAGGCQAEIGSASAMAAGALAFLQGGDSSAIINAATLSLKNFLGLVCDPVAGLVEVPCIKRNVSGAVNAITAAQMTVAGIKSVIPADEVIDSMRRIGNDMPVCLKETGEGGLAITPTAKVYKQKLNNINN